MTRIVVITSDLDIDKMTIPLPIENLTAIAAGGGMSFSPDEERRVLEWCINITCTDPECPINRERIDGILGSNGNLRTLIWEDRVLSIWVLSVWKVIERSRGL